MTKLRKLKGKRNFCLCSIKYIGCFIYGDITKGVLPDEVYSIG